MMWIVATAAGHLFAYHAARRIDAVAEPLRVALSRLETAVDHGLELSAALPREVLVPVIDVLEEADRGHLSGVLTSETALGLARLVLQPARPGLGPEAFSAPAAQPVDLARAVLAAHGLQAARGRAAHGPPAAGPLRRAGGAGGARAGLQPAQPSLRRARRAGRALRASRPGGRHGFGGRPDGGDHRRGDRDRALLRASPAARVPGRGRAAGPGGAAGGEAGRRRGGTRRAVRARRNPRQA